MSEILPPCWVRDMGEEAYRAAPGLSSSMVKKILISPAHMLSSITEPQPSTPSMQFGTWLHRAALFGLAEMMPAIRPEGLDGRTKEGKAWKAEAEATGRTVMTADEHKALSRICENLSNDPDWVAAITSPKKEISAFSNVTVGGKTVLAKCRADLIPAGNAIIDLKTARDVSPDAFSWAVFRYGYHLSAHHYLQTANTVLKANGEPPKTSMLFYAIESSAPFQFRKYLLSEKYFLLADSLWCKAVELYHDCLESGLWPGFPNSIGILEPPTMNIDRMLLEEI